MTLSPGEVALADSLADSATRSVIRVVREGANHLADLSALELLGSEAAYRSLVPEDELRSVIRENIDFILLAMADEPVSQTRSELPALIGRRRAEQGVPLEAVLHSFRIDFHVVWSALLAEASKLCPGEIDALLDDASRLWELIDAASVAVSVAYRGAEAEMAARDEFQRQLVLSALLFGTDPPGPVARDLAAQFQFGERDVFVLVCAEHDDVTGAPGLNHPDACLREDGFISAWCNNGSLQTGVVQIGRRSAADVVATLRAAAQARAGVSPPFAGLHQARVHVWLATAALHALPKGSAQIGMLSDHLASALVAGAPELSLYVAQEVLGPLWSLREGQRERILQTFRVYLQGSGSVTEAAQTLHYHRNSVLSHLQALETLTGRSIHSPRQLAELVIAVTAIELLGEPRAA